MASLFSRKKEFQERYGKRIPPGQTVTEKWPVLHYGSVPKVDLAKWDFRVFGEVEEELRFSYAEFTSLPATEVRCDIHCVTHWSRMDNTFLGVSFKELMKRVRLKPAARFVILHCEQGYTTNLPLDACMDDDVLWAWRHDGKDIAPEHGWPLRLVVPKRYFWKSAKWVRGAEFSAVDKPGYWERNGYHNNADPFTEERYS
ncbi:MAG: sulfite oxidase-like oxidoreductase [Candidatus Tectomicrobia bacterium]|nr:sulfite oxidase-like oxidoreductase [Candidatus Tectomicrobia bacterium]